MDLWRLGEGELIADSHLCFNWMGLSDIFLESLYRRGKMSVDEDDPILRIHESRKEEAKRDAEMRLEIQTQQLESQKKVMTLRIAAEEARQKKIRDSWTK
jgi:hypothetical protein